MPRSRQSPLMKAPRSASTSQDWFAFRNVSDDEAEIDIYGQIGGFSWWDDDEVVTAASFRKKLKEFSNKSKITVHVNSPGGSVFEGLAIYNALKQHDATIKVVVDALAASAASFIAMAADEGELIMARNAVMMIHDASGYAGGNAADFREMADLLDMHSDNIADIYAQRTGEDAVFWRTAMIEETWYTGTEAVAAGLADSVLEDENEEAEKVAAKFDLSVYNYAGREEAPAPSVIHQRIKAQMKKAKEAPVSGSTASTTPKATTAGQPAEDAESNPPVQNPPPAGGESTDPAPGDPAPEAEPVEEEVGKTGDGEPLGGEQPPQGAPAPENAALTVVNVGGVSYRVPAAIANELTVLRTASEENKAAGRKNFVASLATQKKISAGQVDKLEELVDSLDDKQWDTWVASWDAAPALSMLEMHGGSGAGGTTPEATEEATAEIDKLEAIVKHHRQGGMPEDQVVKTPSYMKLQQLKSTTS